MPEQKSTVESLPQFFSRRTVSAANVARFEALLNDCADSGQGCDRSTWPRLIDLRDLRAAPEAHGRLCLKAALAAANPRKLQIDHREWVEGFMIIAEKTLMGVDDGKSPQRAAQFRKWCGCQEEELLRMALRAVVETAQKNAFDLEHDENAAIEWLASGRRALLTLQLLDDLVGAPGSIADLQMPKPRK